MAKAFLEVVINSIDLNAAGVESRDEIEDPLNEALLLAGLGEVTGGGGGKGVTIIDVEILSEDQFDNSLEKMRKILQNLGVPKSTIIKRSSPKRTVYQVY